MPQRQETKDAFNQKTPIFDTYNSHKAGVPVGGGILIIVTTLALYAFFFTVLSIYQERILSLYASIAAEVKIIIFTFVGFGLLGLYDDFAKIFLFKKSNFFGLRFSRWYFLGAEGMGPSRRRQWALGFLFPR